MKKSKSIVFVLTIFALLFVFGVGCKSEQEKYDARISEIRSSLYTSAQGEKIEAIAGEREVPYEVDGVPHGREAFFIVTVRGSYAAPPKYKTEVDGKTYEGVTSKHPFEDSYSFSLDVCPKQQEIAVTLQSGDQERTVTLSKRADPPVTYKQALSTAKAELASPLSSHEKDGVFDGEIYLRLIVDPLQESDKRYWYVAFCTPQDDCFSVLIDSESGSVIARKIA